MPYADCGNAAGNSGVPKPVTSTTDTQVDKPLLAEPMRVSVVITTTRSFDDYEGRLASPVVGGKAR